MKLRRFALGVMMSLLVAALGIGAQKPQGQGEPSSRGATQGPGMRGEARQRPLVGKITAIGSDSIDVAKPDGNAVKVKLSDKTEFRKDREAAKLSDFKVGDFVMVRGEENADHSVNAQMIATRTGGPGGGAGGQMGAMGTMGKDFVVGEVKSIDAPKLTVLRVDNETQTLELNEETSLRRGRESITMADIQVGDHVMVRGGVENDVFVPKFVMVIAPEQWKRMQEMGMMRMGGEGGQKPATGETPQTKPQEQPN